MYMAHQSLRFFRGENNTNIFETNRHGLDMSDGSIVFLTVKQEAFKTVSLVNLACIFLFVP